jgi:Tol biopolymer transport system component
VKQTWFVSGERRGRREPDPLEVIDLSLPVEDGPQVPPTRWSPRRSTRWLVVVVVVAGVAGGLYAATRPGGTHAAAPATQTTLRIPLATTALAPTSSVVPQGRVSHGCVVFARGGPDGGLHLLGASGTPQRLTTVAGDFVPAWSPDGTTIAFERENGDQQLWVIDSRGSELRRLTAGRSDGGPTWSPDGSQIRFTRRTVGRTDFDTVAADGTGLRRLVLGQPNDASPAWSPDRASIAFVSTDRAGNFGIFVTRADGSGRTRIARQIQGAWPKWSPDGTQLAFVNEADGSIYVSDPRGTRTRRVFDVRTLNNATEPNFTLPAWSPDGTMLVFAAGNPFDSHLYTITLGGNHVTQLTTGTVTDASPAWSATPCQ